MCCHKKKWHMKKFFNLTRAREEHDKGRKALLSCYLNFKNNSLRVISVTRPQSHRYLCCFSVTYSPHSHHSNIHSICLSHRILVLYESLIFIAFMLIVFDESLNCWFMQSESIFSKKKLILKHPYTLLNYDIILTVCLLLLSRSVQLSFHKTFFFSFFINYTTLLVRSFLLLVCLYVQQRFCFCS